MSESYINSIESILKKEEKKENNAIYVVATPIGNLEDITIRALKTLNSVDFILAEDTRVTIKLLNHYGIKKTIYSYHSHSLESKTNEYIKQILEGKSVALVSDAGTPCISDPGVGIIKKAIEKNIKIIPIGGISAFTTLLSASGISGDTLFVGFLSNKKQKRKNQLSTLKENEKNIIVLYESVHRVLNCIEDINEVFGENTQVIVGRELTKQFEQIVRNNAKNMLAFFKNNHIILKGEYCIIIDNRVSKVCKPNAENVLSKES